MAGVLAALTDHALRTPYGVENTPRLLCRVRPPIVELAAVRTKCGQHHSVGTSARVLQADLATHLNHC
eukprot:5632886-Pyramimonas_sp.AAC.1